jgi:hypothetical protein
VDNNKTITERKQCTNGAERFSQAWLTCILIVSVSLQGANPVAIVLVAMKNIANYSFCPERSTTSPHVCLQKTYRFRVSFSDLINKMCQILKIPYAMLST